MYLQNDYKILYEGKDEGVRAGFATKELPYDGTDSKVTLFVAGDGGPEVHLADYRIVYEKAGIIYGGKTAFPTDEDEVLVGKDIAGKLVIGKEV